MIAMARPVSGRDRRINGNWRGYLSLRPSDPDRVLAARLARELAPLPDGPLPDDLACLVARLRTALDR